MQNAEAGKKSASCSDEDSINFRPSPNFKHMKKYLKSKFEEMSGIESNNEVEKVNNSQNEREEEKCPQVKASLTPPPTTTVQPPLPPNPPPPDSPVKEIKQELIDYDYVQFTTVPTNEDVFGQDTPVTVEQEVTPKATGAEVTMCRNFVRGTCKKGAACIFAHELILSQLTEVYTFCRNFQNRQCTFAKCKFVHATVFEKEYFYRTGYLPPHTIAHLKALPPLPPPPEETLVQDIAQQGYYIAPALDTNVTSMPGIGMECTTVPTYMLQSPHATDSDSTLYAPGTSTSSTTNPGLKRDWSETLPTDESTYRSQFHTETELSTGESLPKKCKNCDSNEFRYEYHKNKVEDMISATEEINKKMAQLNVKNHRLCTVLVSLFKPQTPAPASSLSTLTSALEDKDKNMLEQINLHLGIRTSAIAEEDTMKNLLGNNVNFQLIAKLLMSAAEQPAPQ